jgi:hypothetical protein
MSFRIVNIFDGITTPSAPIITAPDIVYNQATPTDWVIANPTLVNLALDELGSRMTSTETQTSTNVTDIGTNATNIGNNASAITTLDGEVVKKTGVQTIGGDKTFSDDVVIDGDLTVNGTTTTLNTENLDVEDNNITVNSGGNDVSAEGAGIEVERTGANGCFKYEDALDSKFKIGPAGDVKEISTIVKDTKANLDAIVTKSTSTMYFATDEDNFYGYDVTNDELKLLGGGSGSGVGSPSIYKILNNEDESAADWTDSTNATTSDEAGAELLNGAFSYKMVFTAINENCTSPLFSLNKRGNEGAQSHKCSFVASSNANGVLAQVLNSSDDILGEIALVSGQEKYEFLYEVADGLSDIKFRVDSDAEAAATVYIDDIVFDDEAFLSKDLIINNMQPSRRVKTDTQSVSNATWNQLTFNVEEYDDDNLHDASKWVAPHDCKISVSSMAHFAASTGNADYRLGIARDGVVSHELARVSTKQVDGDNQIIQPTGSMEIDVVEGEEISIWARQTTGGNLNVGGAADQNFFTVSKINVETSSHVITPASSNLSNWEPYTPSNPQNGFGNLANQEFYYRQVGGNLEVLCRCDAGTVSAAEARIALPNGLTINTNITSPVYVGTMMRGSNTVQIGHVLASDGDNYFNFSSPTVSTGGLTKALATNLIGSGEAFSFYASVPVAEYDAVSQILGAIPFQGPVAPARYHRNVSDSVLNNTLNYVNFGGKNFDRDNLVTTGADMTITPAIAWKYTAKRDGELNVKVQIQIDNGISWDASEYFDLKIMKNAALYSESSWDCTATDNNVYFTLRHSDIVDVLEGDDIQIAIFQNSGQTVSIPLQVTRSFVAISQADV